MNRRPSLNRSSVSSFVSASSKRGVNLNALSTASSNVGRMANLEGFNMPLNAQRLNEMARKIIAAYAARGITDTNKAAEMTYAELNKFAQKKGDRAKIYKAVMNAKKSMKNAIKRTGGRVRNAAIAGGSAVGKGSVMAGKGGYVVARAPNRAVRRGFFGMMQRVQQFRADKVPQKNIFAKFARRKNNIISESARLKAAWNRYFKQKRQELENDLQALKNQAARKPKELDNKRVKDIQAAWQETKVNLERQEKISNRAKRWGNKRNTITYK